MSRGSGLLARWPSWPGRGAFALALCSLLWACGEDETVPLAEWRAGDGLLERLPTALLLEWPGTNLPAAVLSAVTEAGTVLVRSPALAAAAWVGGEAVASELLPEDVIAAGRRPRQWEAPGAHAELSGADPASVSFWVGPTRLPDLADLGDKVPELVVAWDRQLQSLAAMADVQPTGVCVVRPLPAGEVFGDRELLLASEAAAESPLLSSLVQRTVTATDTRAGLLLPAPGRLSFPGATLAADTLQLAVRLLPRAYGVTAGGALRLGPSASDGVVCAVDLVVLPDTMDQRTTLNDLERRRVWEQSLTVSDGLFEATIDLSSWRGRGVVLQLVSEPGPAGDKDDDWVQWSGLRLLGPPAGSPSRPHLVLIDIDTLRADALGSSQTSETQQPAETQQPSNTPHLDRWAEQHALVFDDMLSVASWTLPATATLLTGLAVHQHGVDHRSRVLAPEALPLAQRLSLAGYETKAITEGGYVGPSFGFDGGFDTYQTVPQRTLDWDGALSWVSERQSERPFFLFLQSYMVHAPYPHDERLEDPSRPYAGAFAGQGVGYAELIHPFERGELTLSADDEAYVRRMYRAGVTHMDEVVGRFIESLEETLAGEPFVLVLTSDHGEAFFEHGLIDHHKSLYDEVLAVPFLLRLPEGSVGRRSEPASLVDLVPTILDALGLPAPTGLPGRSLLQPAREHVARVAQHSESARSLTLGADKLIVGQAHAAQDPQLTVQLFDLAVDPGELSERALQDPALVTHLQEHLAYWLSAWPAPQGASTTSQALDEAALGDLAALGYLGDEGDDR